MLNTSHSNISPNNKHLIHRVYQVCLETLNFTLCSTTK